MNIDQTEGRISIAKSSPENTGRGRYDGCDCRCVYYLSPGSAGPQTTGQPHEMTRGFLTAEQAARVCCTGKAFGRRRAVGSPWRQDLFHDPLFFWGTAPEVRLNRAAFRIEIEKCEKCGAKVRVIVDASNRCIEDEEVIEKILKHLGLDQDSDPQNRSPPAELTDQQTTLF